MRFYYLILLLLFPVISLAAQYKGYKRGPTSALLTFQEPIDRYIETDAEFLILFKNHPSFYSFPKERDRSVDARNYLNFKKNKKTPVKVEYDAVTTKIYSLSD